MLRALRKKAAVAALMSLASAPLYGANFTPTTSLPDSHYGHALVTTSGYLYNIGGLSGTVGWQGGLNVYKAALQPNGTVGAWVQTTPLPEAVFFHTAVASNGFIYVLGGWHYVNGIVASATVYWAKVNPDGTLAAWQTGPAMPQTLFFLSAAAWNGRVYVTGGWNATTSVLSNQVYSAQIQPDGSLGQWTTQRALPEAVYTHAAVSNGTLYVLGGVDNNGTQIENLVYYAPILADGTLGAWSTTTPLPQALANHAAAVANASVIVTGGWTGAGATNASVSATVNPDGSLGTWSSYGTLPDSIYLHAEAASANWLYVSGGNDGQNPQSAVYYAALPAPSVAVDTAPPTTTLSVGAPQYGSSPMFVSPATPFSLSAVDGVGVAQTLYALDSATWTAYAAPIRVPTDGSHWLRYLSVNKLGNQESPHAASFSVDGTAPASTLLFGAPQAVLASGDVVVSTHTLLQVQAADPVVGGVASGVGQILAGVDGAALSPAQAAFAAPASDGVHSITIQSIDHVGNAEAAHPVRVLVDGTAPQTGVAASPAAFNASDGGAPYISAAAIVSLSAQDPVVGGVASGVNHTDFEIDGGAAASYSGGFGLSEGAHSVQARSVDNVGNAESWKAFSYRVDGTAPQTTAQLPGGVTLFGVDIVAPGSTLGLSAQDPVSNGVASGVGQILFSVDGGASQAYSAPIALPEGAHAVSFQAVDKVGNAEDSRTLSFAATRFLSQALAAMQSITVSGGASVTGDVSAPSVTTNGHATISGTVTHSAPVLAYDLAAAGAWAQANNNDAAIASSLSGGALDLASGQTVALPDGDYYLTGLSLSGGASLTVSNRANVFVHGNVSVSGHAAVNASSDATGLWIVSDGANVTLSGQSRQAFNLYAPSAAVSVSGGGQFAGRVLAQSISLSGGAAQPSTTSLPAATHQGHGKTISVAQAQNGSGTASAARSGGQSVAVASSRQDDVAPQAADGSQAQADQAGSAPTSVPPGASSSAGSTPAPQRISFTWPGLSLSSHSALGVVADQGGSVASPDGSGVSIPQGAASSGLNVTVAPAPPADPVEDQKRKTASAALGLTAAASAVQFGPEGTQFIKPVTLALPYDTASLPPNASEQNLAVYYWNPTKADWEAMPSIVDVQARVVRAQTTHFSLYQIMAGATPQSGPQASNDVASAQIACNPLRNGCQPMKFQSLPAGARLRIYTLTGALVKDMAADGTGSAVWDGTNKSGQPVGSGLYFVFAQGNGTTKTLKVAVER